MGCRALAKHSGVLAFFVGVTLSGCVSSRLAPTVVSYDKAVEKAQNEMLLLNIVRAAKWKPMYLIDISKITGSIKQDLTASLAAPFGSSNVSQGANYTATMGGTLSLNPTFDVNVLNTQEFMKGFLQPVTTDQIRYFLSQNWPPEFLLPLFVLQVDDVPDEDSPGQTKSLFNHPHFDDEKNTDLRAFSAWVVDFTRKPLRLVTYETEKTEDMGPPVEINGADAWAKVVGAAKDNFHLKQCQPPSPASPKYEYQLYRVPNENIGPPVEINDADALAKVVSAVKDNPHLKEVPRSGPESPWYQLERVKSPVRYESILMPVADENGNPKKVPDTLDDTACKKARPPSKVQPDESFLRAEYNNQCVTLHLRSPEAILYYLGQIVRLGEAQGKWPQVLTRKGLGAPQDKLYETMPLFVAVKSAPNKSEDKSPRCGRGSVAVTDEEGETYVIPKQQWPPKEKPVPLSEADAKKQPLQEMRCGQPSMSYDVLTILTQLIALHKSVTQTSVTPLVRVVGQ